MSHSMLRWTAPLTTAALIFVAPAAFGLGVNEHEAVRRAFEDNPSFHATGLEAQAAQQSLEAAESEREPVLRAVFGGGLDTSFDAALGYEPLNDGTMDLDLGLDWTSRVGTQLTFEVGGYWRPQDGAGDNVDGFDSAYGTEARFRVTQPLLRGAGSDVVEARERAARYSRDAADHAQRDAASKLVSDVLQAYGELWYAEESLAVNREALVVAQRQLDEAETRASVLGTLAPAEVLRFASELASIEEDMSQAQSDRRSRALELGRLLGASPQDSLALEVPAEAPAHDLSMTLDEAVELARLQSAELLELRAGVEAARDRVVVAEDGTLPRLDLTATVAMGGLWGSTFGVGGGYESRDSLGASGIVGLSLELPIGNGQARAELAETRIRADAAELRYEGRSRQIETEAATSLDRLETARTRVELATRSVNVARQLAEAEEQALRLGTTTAFQVLEAQANYRRTEHRRLRALVDQSKAAIAIQHLTGQLLSAYGDLAASL